MKKELAVPGDLPSDPVERSLVILREEKNALALRVNELEMELTSVGQANSNYQSALHGEWSWRGKINELIILLKRRMEKDGRDCRCQLCQDTVTTLERQGIIFRDESTANHLIDMTWKPWEK